MGLRKQPFKRRSSDSNIFKQDNSYTTNELDLYLKRKENSEQCSSCFFNQMKQHARSITNKAV